MATYKDDLDILKAAEKDSSKLSLNAITELDNKGLLGMYGGGGDSPLKLAKVTLLPDSSDLAVGDVFDSQFVAIYFPENGTYPPFVNAISLTTPAIPFNNWNLRMERGKRIVALQGFNLKTDRYEYAIEGDAEIMDDDGEYIFVTGDCTITVTSKPSE